MGIAARQATRPWFRSGAWEVAVVDRCVTLCYSKSLEGGKALRGLEERQPRYSKELEGKLETIEKCTARLTIIGAGRRMWCFPICT